MNMPSNTQIYDVVDATWPAAKFIPLSPWMLREGSNGGQRVSSASLTGDFNPNDIQTAATAMRDMGQNPLFQIRDGNDALDAQLDQLGYKIKDPVVIYVAPIEALTTDRPPPVTAFQCWPPLATQLDIWQTGGIGAGRIAVMERAAQPKTTLLGRINDQPAGTVYCGIHTQIAMLHALEILPAQRRQGLAAMLTRATAFWARDNGATHFSLVTTAENEAANALYASLGMRIVGKYHYRVLPE